MINNFNEQIFNNLKSIKDKLNNNLVLLIITILSIIIIVFLVNIYNFINYNSDKFIFNTTKTIYWIFVINFILLLLIKINNESFRKHSTKFLFIIIFLYLLYWIPYQIDITDTGKQFSISWFFLKNIKNTFLRYNDRIGAYFINGLWLRIFGKPLILWGRIGYILVICFSAVFAYKIIKLYYFDIYVFIGMIITTIFITCSRANQVIDHNNLPVLFILISIYLFCLFINNLEKNGIKKYIYNISSSLFILLSILTRLPIIIFSVFPLIYFFIYYFSKNKNNKILFFNIATHYSSYFIILIILLLIKINNNFLLIYIFNTLFFMIYYITINLFHNKIPAYPIVVMKIYLYHMMFITIGSTILILFYYIFKKIINKYKDYKYNNNLINLIFIILSFLFLLFVLVFFEKKYIWFVFTISFIFSFLVLSIFKNIDNKNILIYIIFGIVLMLASMLGSNVGIKLMITNGGIFLIMPLIIAVIRKNKDMIFKKDKLIYQIVIFVFYLILAIGVIKKYSNNNVRDMPIKYATKMFKTEALFGVFSTTDKVQVIDDVVSYIKSNVDNNDSILFFNSIPIFYYILDRKYFFNEPWLVQLPQFLIVENMEKINLNNQPKYILFAKKSTRETKWPLTDKNCRITDIDTYNYMLAFANLYYKIDYENSAFILFKRK